MFLTKFDILSSPINLYSNSKGNHRLTSKVGGFISILFILCAFSGGVYFIQDYFQFKKPNVYMSESNKQNITFSSFNNLVFGLRITDEFGNNFEEENRLFRFTNDWVTTKFKNNTITQEYHSIEINQCQSENFLSKDRELINNYKKLSSFSCIDWKSKEMNYDMYGLYGDQINLYRMNAVLVYQCTNDTNTKANCFSIEEIDKRLNNAYLEYFTLSSYLLHENKSPITKIISTVRLSLSNMNYKRIWLGLSQIEYSTDFGMVFENLEKETYYNLIKYNEESKLLNKDSVNKGNDFFSILSFQNHPVFTSYMRTYLKLQDILANIGGIVEALRILTSIIIFIIGDKLSNLSLFNHLPIIEKSNMMKTLNLYEKRQKLSNIKEAYDKAKDISNNMSSLTKTNLVFKNNYQKKDSFFIKKTNIPMTITSISTKVNYKIKLKWFDYVNCFNINRLKSSNRLLYERYIELLIQLLSVESLFTTIYKTDQLSKILLSNEENALLDFLSKSTKNLVVDKDNIVNLVSMSEKNVNYRIIQQLDDIVQNRIC